MGLRRLRNIISAFCEYRVIYGNAWLSISGTYLVQHATVGYISVHSSRSYHRCMTEIIIQGITEIHYTFLTQVYTS